MYFRRWKHLYKLSGFLGNDRKLYNYKLSHFKLEHIDYGKKKKKNDQIESGVYRREDK